MMGYELLYYIYILFFGVYVSMRIGAGGMDRRSWRILLLSGTVMLLIQGLTLTLLGSDSVWKLYPLITHLPMAMVLICFLKLRWDKALLSVIISYCMCQLPRWLGLVIYSVIPQGVGSVAVHIALSQLLLMLLAKYCLGALHEITRIFERPLPRLGSLPVLYYLFEYFMLYTDRRFAGMQFLNELLPTGLVLFYILFIIVYQNENHRRTQVQHQADMLEMELEYAGQEIELLRVIQEKTAIHRHDLRHHLMMIDSLISAGKSDQAAGYIHKVSREIEAVSPLRCCENETVNLLLGVFRSKADEAGVKMSIDASLPPELPLPDPELCALLSNGLENAMNAALRLPRDRDAEIAFCCAVKQNKLLVEIRNPYEGEIVMENGLPAGKGDRACFGCRSIQSIALNHRGMCAFDGKDGVFTLRVVIPMK